MSFTLRFTAIILLLIGAFAFSGCSDDGGSGVSGGGGTTDDTLITITAINGVAAPVLGETPVTTTSETDQYTGTVIWDGGWAWSPYFGGNKAYTATITLTAKAGYTLTGISANFFTVSGADTVTNDVDNGMTTALFPTTVSVSVGDAVCGGKLAYILQAGVPGYVARDPAYVAGEQRGLIASPEKLSGGIVWISGGSTQSTSVPGGTDLAVGAGSTNTDNIIAQAVAAGNNILSSYAAGLARAYDGGGYDDWYLPSEFELQILCNNKIAIGGDSTDVYWKSTEFNADQAASHDFGSDNSRADPKWGELSVRAVRAF